MLMGIVSFPSFHATLAAIFIWAFGAMPVSESQFAALLAFHYNTGAILRTDLMDLLHAGQTKAARAFWTSHYLNGGDLQARRNAEAKLFFDGVWDGDGKTISVVPVSKPSYQPSFRGAVKRDLSIDMAKAMAA